MYITNSEDVAHIAEEAGVDRIFVDMEYIGKTDRQGGMDTVQSRHTADDVRRLAQCLNKAELFVRVNPIHEKTDEYNEDNCVQIEEKNYCVAKEATKAIEEENLSIGDSYQVSGLKEKELILVMWLTNLNESQNEFDVGSYQATVTIQAGNGGEVKGTIASAVKLDPTPEGGGA